MSIKNINAALVQAYINVGLDLKTAYELRDFTPPTGSPWAAVQNFPADKYVVTLGDQGEDNITGFFQIDLHVPENDGTSRIAGYMDAILDYFKNGRIFTYGGQEVRVRRSQLTPIQPAKTSASYVSTISVYWDSRKQR